MTAIDNPTLTVELPVYFRLATKKDLPKLEWFGQYKHYRQLFKRSFREQQAGRRLMLLADCNEFPVGHIFVQLVSKEESIANGSDRAYLYSLRVMDMFRNQGIGTQLIQTAEAIVAERGFCVTTIAVAKDNHGAKRLYQRLGYRILREDDGKWSYLDHTGTRRYVHEPCWILVKDLSV